MEIEETTSAGTTLTSMSDKRINKGTVVIISDLGSGGNCWQEFTFDAFAKQLTSFNLVLLVNEPPIPSPRVHGAVGIFWGPNKPKGIFLGGSLDPMPGNKDWRWHRALHPAAPAKDFPRLSMGQMVGGYGSAGMCAGFYVAAAQGGDKLGQGVFVGIITYPDDQLDVHFHLIPRHLVKPMPEMANQQEFKRVAMKVVRLVSAGDKKLPSAAAAKKAASRQPAGGGIYPPTFVFHRAELDAAALMAAGVATAMTTAPAAAGVGAAAGDAQAPAPAPAAAGGGAAASGCGKPADGGRGARGGRGRGGARGAGRAATAAGQGPSATQGGRGAAAAQGGRRGAPQGGRGAAGAQGGRDAVAAPGNSGAGSSAGGIQTDERLESQVCPHTDKSHQISE